VAFDLSHPFGQAVTQVVLDEYEQELVRPPHLRRVPVTGESHTEAE
jgi:hypothetical protein